MDPTMGDPDINEYVIATSMWDLFPTEANIPKQALENPLSAMGLLVGAAGSPRTGAGRGAGSLRFSPVLVALLLISAIVGYMGFQALRVRKESDSKDAELNDVYQELQVARRLQDELRQTVASLNAEKEKVSTDKSNISTQLIQLERYKRLSEEEKVKLEASLSDKENQISSLKQQLKEVENSEKEALKLKGRLKDLESQLELTKAKDSSNVTTSTGMQNTERDSVEEAGESAAANLDDKEGIKKQGEDLEHGLVAADKAEAEETSEVTTGTTKSQDVDDRKRGQVSSSDDETEKVDEDLDVVKADDSSSLQSKAEDNIADPLE